MKKNLRKKAQRFFFYLIWKFLPTCKEFVPMLSESLDGKLSLYKKIIIKLHLLACPPCVRYLKQIKFLSDATHKCDENLLHHAPDAKLSNDARERLKDLLKTSVGAFGLFLIF